MSVKIKFKRLMPNAKIPTYATTQSAGMDCYAPQYSLLMAGERRLVKLGFAMQLPEGYEAQIRPRSGLALNNGIMVSNSPGTIDADYRGEVGVILWNTEDRPYTIKTGDRICQMVIQQVPQATWVVDTLDDTERGEGGFGSTNI